MHKISFLIMARLLLLQPIGVTELRNLEKARIILIVLSFAWVLLTDIHLEHTSDFIGKLFMRQLRVARADASLPTKSLVGFQRSIEQYHSVESRWRIFIKREILSRRQPKMIKFYCTLYISNAGINKHKSSLITRRALVLHAHFWEIFFRYGARL